MRHYDGQSGVGNGRGDPGAGDPPGTPPTPSISLATDIHPLPTVTLHGDELALVRW
jgi:hypothetical protein